MGKFLEKYLSTGEQTEQKVQERLGGLMLSIAGAAGQIRETRPVPESSQHFAEMFRELWIDAHFSSWKKTVCGPPPQPNLRASIMWIPVVRRTLAGLEHLLVAEDSVYSGNRLASLLADHAGLSDQMMEAVKEAAGSVSRQNAADIEELLTATEELLDRRAVELLSVLPNVPFEKMDSMTEPEERGGVLARLGEAAPVTCAVAWRLVLELERCRDSYQGNVTDQLQRLSWDRTSDLHRVRDGMVWAGLVLWHRHGRAIEAHAGMEGAINRQEADANVKAHLTRLQALLDDEVDGVTATRAMEAR